MVQRENRMSMSYLNKKSAVYDTRLAGNTNWRFEHVAGLHFMRSWGWQQSYHKYNSGSRTV